LVKKRGNDTPVRSSLRKERCNSLTLVAKLTLSCPMGLSFYSKRGYYGDMSY
jgi:hypothetical protein